MRNIFVVGVLLLLMGTITFCSQPEKVKQLKVNGIQLQDVDRNDVVLKGVSYGWHNWWPRFYNKESVAWLKNDWKCNVVRAAMGVGPDTSYLDEPAWSKGLVEEVIQGAIDNNIYVIIDWHSHGIYTKEAVGFFTEMAQKYGSYPNIIYEIYNEPVNDSWDEVKSYSIEVIKAIRAIDKNNVILVGCPHWDQDIHLVADAPITGYDNLMYTVHFYAATHKEYLRERSDYAMSKGIPIFISESAGMEASGNGPMDYESWNVWIKWMEDNKLSWITWMVADKNETCAFLYPTAKSIGGWTDADMKESGLKTREAIKAYYTKK